jgi:hypothetical protein
MPATLRAVHSARPETRSGARLVRTASFKTIMTLRNARNAMSQVVRPVLSKLIRMAPMGPKLA